MIEIPQRAEREYFRAFGAFALFLTAPPARSPCRLGCSRDVGQSLEGIRKRWPCEISHAWWLSGIKNARAVVAAVTAAFPPDGDGFLGAHADEVASQIEATARSLRLSLTQHAVALAHVKVAVAHIDAMLDGANANGELAWFNRAYRQWRAAAAREVASALPYGLARARLRAAVVRRAARGGALALDPALCAEVFAPTGRR